MDIFAFDNQNKRYMAKNKSKQALNCDSIILFEELY